MRGAFNCMDTVKDTSGSGSDGVIHGAQWVKVPGGHALEFDGINSYVDCGDKPSLDLRGPVTTMAWVCPAGVQPAKEPGIYGKQFSSYLVTYYSNRKLFWYINSGGNNTSASVPPSIWSHIATTFDGKLLRIYVNGELLGQSVSQAGRVNAGKKFYIGCVMGDVEATDPNYQQTGAFKGMVDDVRVYSRALSEEEIRAQINATDSNRNAMFAATLKPVKRGETIRSGTVSVIAGKDGALQIRNGKSFCVLDSQFSYPGEKIGWHILGQNARWSPEVNKLDSTTLQIIATGTHYSLIRTVRLRNGRIFTAFGVPTSVGIPPKSVFGKCDWCTDFGRLPVQTPANSA